MAGVQNEVESIRDELDTMKAFLGDVEKLEESGHELTKAMVDQVRDLAYYIEDVLDEYTVHLMPRPPVNGFYGSFQKIYHSIKNLKTRHQIASKMQDIKSKVIEIHERLRRYNINIGDIQHHKQGSTSSTVANNTWNDRRRDALVIEESELVGIEKPKKQLIELLIDGDYWRRVVSVEGMGGLGKTTLVKKVYDDVQVRRHFKHHMWITVSKSFKADELLKDMIEQLYEEMKQPPPPEIKIMNRASLTEQLKNILQGTRYILVMDDVWEKDAWEDIRYALPDNNGSRVMLTTRIADVAAYFTASEGDHRYKLEQLSESDSWTLFSKKTFQGKICPPHLEQISHRILHRCEGLPLAIVAVSGVLATKDKSRVDEWNRMDGNLGAEMEGNDKGLSFLKKILSLSYSDLPYYLKNCLLYMTIFPEDHKIDRMRLIRLWMAGEFVRDKQGMTREEAADDCLNDLLNRNLIQVAVTTTDGRAKKFHIHDLVREMLLPKAKDQLFIAVAGEKALEWPAKVRHLSICNTLQNVQLNRTNSNWLRSLLTFGVVDSEPMLSILPLSSYRLLRVLDLTDTSLEVFPDKVVNLYYLRYLSLRNTKVKTVPSSIGRLENLETLDLKHTHVTELPAEVLKLRQLRHLLAYRYNYPEAYISFQFEQGFKAPAGIGELVYLQKLSYIEASQGSDTMGEIGRLKQLRRLAITKLRREDGIALCSSIEKLQSLRSLIVAAIEEKEILDIQNVSSPPQFLQRIILEGRLEKVPQWIPLVQTLVRVRLRWSQLKEDPLESLGALPNLVEIQLLQAYVGEELCFKDGAFRALKVLWLEKLRELRCVRVEKGTMPLLELLIIQQCDMLKKIPSGFEHLTKLNRLELDDMPNELISTLDPEGEDYWKVAHIPEVSIGHYENLMLGDPELERGWLARARE